MKNLLDCDPSELIDFVEVGLVIDGRPGFGGTNDPRRKVVGGFTNGTDGFLSSTRKNNN
jgi:hypothetical protein